MEQIFNAICWFNDYTQANKTILLISLLLIIIGIIIFFIVDYNVWNKTGKSLWNKGNKKNKRK